jgi:hypothetical protein
MNKPKAEVKVEAKKPVAAIKVKTGVRAGDDWEARV